MTATTPNIFSIEVTPVNGDLSREIERIIPREPQDRVRCVRVFNNCYRCNWWAPYRQPLGSQSSIPWGTGTTHHVRQSRFLIASAKEKQLSITEIDAVPQSDRLA